MDKQHELNLVQQAQQGDHESYGRLADLYGGSVLAIAYSRVGDFAASQDIAQDALVLAFEKLGQLRSPQDFGAWLRTITRNLCHRWQRNQAYRRRLREDCTALRERLGYGETAAPRENLEAGETTRLIDCSLQGLPPKEREALLLYYFEGKSVDEAAQLAGIAPAAMRKRLQRARDRLRDVLNAQVEAGLLEISGRRKMSALVLAAIPTGTTFGKVAQATSVVSSKVALSLRGASGGAAGKVAAAGLAALLVVGAFLAIRHDVDSSHRAGTSENASPADSPVAVDGGKAADRNAGTSNENGEALVEEATVRGANGKLDEESGIGLCSISGTVRDTGGNPVVGARVEAIRRSDFDDPTTMARDVMEETTTSADGQYAFRALPPTEDRVMIFVTHPEWANGGGRTDALTAGESRDQVNFTLVSPTAVTGVVIDEEGRPIPDASVFLCAVAHLDFYGKRKEGRAPGPWIPASRYGCFARATTNGDGAFTLDHIPEGWVISRLGAWKEGYALSYAFSKEADERAKRLLESGEGSNWWASDIPPGTKSIRVVLKRGAAVRGRVVLAETGEPVGGALVAVDGTIEAETLEHGRLGYERTTESDENGHFSLEDLACEDLRFCVAKGGLKAAPRKIRVAPGKTGDAGTFMLSEPGGFSGIALDADTGRPLSDFWIAYQLEGVDGRMESLQTNGSGRYHADGVPAGEWRVFAHGAALELSRQHHALAEHQNHIVATVRSGQTTEGVNLHFVREHDPRGAISGRVVGSNGAVVAGALVRLSGDRRQAATNDEGVYRAIRVQSGRRTLTAVDPASGHYGTAEATIPDGGEAVADVRLAGRTGRISGRVMNEAGEVVQPGIEVWISGGLLASENIHTDEDGAYTTGPIPPGTYTVKYQAAAKGYRVDQRRRRVAIREGEEATVDFVLIAMSGFVGGTAVLENGEPAAHCQVSVGSSHGVARGQTDDEGRFHIEPIDGDNVYVRVGRPDSESPWAQVKDVELNRDDLRIVLHEPGILKGYIASVEGDPQPASISVESVDYHSYSRAEGGSFLMRLQPGTYSATVRSSSRTRRFGDIVVAAGMETDMGTIELDGGTGVIVGAVAVQGLPEHASETAIYVQARVVDGEQVDVSTPTTEAVDGAFRLEKLYPGRYVVIVRATYGGGVRQLQQSVEVSDGSEGRADFTVTFGDSTLTGTVDLGSLEFRDPVYPVFVFKPGTCPFREGEDLSGRGDYLEDLVAMAMASASDGAFTCPGLVAGTYDVAVMRQGEDRTSARVDVQRVAVAAGGETVVHLSIAE